MEYCDFSVFIDNNVLTLLLNLSINVLEMIAWIAYILFPLESEW